MKRFTYNSFSSLGWFNLFWIFCVLGYWFFLSPNTYSTLAYDEHASPFQAEKAWKGLTESEDISSILFENYSAQQLGLLSFNSMFSYDIYQPNSDKIIFTDHRFFYVDTTRKLIGVHEQDSLKANKLINKLVFLVNQRVTKTRLDSITLKRKDLIISKHNSQIVYDSLQSVYARYQNQYRLFNNSYLIKDTLIALEKSLTKYLVQIRSIDNHLESHETLVKTIHPVIELNDASFNKSIIRPNLFFLVIAWLMLLNTLWFLVQFFLNKVRLW